MCSYEHERFVVNIRLVSIVTEYGGDIRQGSISVQSLSHMWIHLHIQTPVSKIKCGCFKCGCVPHFHRRVYYDFVGFEHISNSLGIRSHLNIVSNHVVYRQCNVVSERDYCFSYQNTIVCRLCQFDFFHVIMRPFSIKMELPITALRWLHRFTHFHPSSNFNMGKS